MNDLAARAIELATADMGVTEHPPGSNSGPEVNAYLASVGLRPGNPWCAAFLCFHIQNAANELSWPLQFKRSGSTLHLYELNWRGALAAPQDGCVFVHRDADGVHGHAGFVIKMNPDGSFQDLSGNSDALGSRTGGTVCSNIRSAGFAQAFFEIK